MGKHAFIRMSTPSPAGSRSSWLALQAPKAGEHEDAVTQDFLATSHSVTSTVRDAGQFIAFIRAARKRRTLPFTLARTVGILESLRIPAALTLTVILSRVSSMATEHYAGTAPIKYGPYAVKFTVRPPEGTLRTAEPQTHRADFLREDLAAG